MIDGSITYCSNDKCSKKKSCLRYTERSNIKYGQTYISMTEEQCEKNKCYINIDEYNRKMIMDIINKVPNDELDKKLILESCYSNFVFKVIDRYNLINLQILNQDNMSKNMETT